MRANPLRGLAIVVAALGVWQPIGAAPAPLVLVKDGKPNAVIVIQGKIPERCKAGDEFTFPGRRPRTPLKTAQILQSFLARITGAELPIEKEQTDPKAPAIHVGLTDFAAGLEIPFARYDRDAIILKRSGSQVVLTGVDDWGTEMSVYEFLERVCGVRWFIPGPLGEVVPASKEIAVGELDVVEEPSYLSRMLSGVQSSAVRAADKQAYADHVEWMRRNRLRERFEFHHNLWSIFSPRKYAEEHPEYYPRVGGKRLVPKPGAKADWQPCMSHPDVAATCVKAASDFFGRFPGNCSFSLGVNDNYGYCECDKCLKLNGGIAYAADGKRNYSPMYFRFVNGICQRLEKEYPDKLLGGLIYVSGTMTPPPFPVHRNFVGYMPNDRSRYLFDRDFRRKEKAFLASWAAKCKTLGIYEWFFGSGYEIPRFYPHTVQAVLKDGHQLGVRGFYAEAYPHWGLDGPRLYIACKLLWNVDADVDALLDDYCAKSFGAAREPMKQYFRKLEACWVGQPVRTRDPFICCYLRKVPAQLGVYPLPAAEQCGKLLERAARLADTDIARKRVAAIRDSFGVTRYYVERQAIYDRLEVTPGLDGLALSELVHNLNAMHHLSVSHARHTAAHIRGKVYTLYGGQAWRFRSMEPCYSRLGARIVAALIEAQKADKPGLGATGQHLRGALTERFAAIAQRAAALERDGAMGPAWPKLADSVRRFTRCTTIIPSMKTPPTIDGTAGKDEWQGAEELSGFELLKGKGPVKHATTVRIGFDERSLYAAFTCPEASMKHLLQRYRERDTAVWQDDAVELLVLPAGAEPADFYHFIVNSLGAVYDAHAGSGTWNGSATIAATQNAQANTWTMEIAVPWKDLGGRPAAGELWRANFCRDNPEPAAAHGTGEWSSWCPSFAGFNSPEYFGLLLFR